MSLTSFLFRAARLSAGETGYVAGLIDGEGCIYAQLQKSTRAITPTARVRLTITNSDTALMDWLESKIGGRVYALSQKDGWKRRYNWDASATIIRELLPATMPFLVLKRRRAEIALELLATRTPFGSGPGRVTFQTPPEVLSQRVALIAELRALNQRGVAA